MDMEHGWGHTPSPRAPEGPLQRGATIGGTPAPIGPASIGPAPIGSAPPVSAYAGSPRGDRRRRPGTALAVSALVVALVALGVGIVAAAIGVFCVVFITAFGAPLEVTRPAMAGFAVRGSAVTAVPFAAALVLLAIAAVRRIEARWWVPLAAVNAITLVGLGIAALIWFHPGVHVSWDFSS
ncbi:hypothetical protein [Curtobacterium sp. Leaf183]|uniref:hypothetical protein n=1 Tax=Curtobacterium sp. Leaf183 TaxID=1736291 RepID=UPI0012E90BCB|nr:hypothetical protein [Curtobacterium sp. Leaf183]